MVDSVSWPHSKGGLMFKVIFSLLVSSSAFGSVTVSTREAVLKHFESQGFSGAVGVFAPNAALEKAYGLDRGRPLKSSDHFLIGSISKQFTAAAIMKLVDQGRLSVEDHVAKYIPGFQFQDVTIHHLLAHLSGIAEVTDTAEFDSLRKNEFVNLDPLIALLLERPQEFRAGTKWSYSNSNYLLLSRVVEIVSGETWWSFVQRELVAAAGMRETDFLSGRGTKLIAGHRLGRDGELVEIENEAYLERGWANGAGGIESTVADLAIWNWALHGGQLVSAKSLKLMTTPHGNVGDGISYGYGLFLKKDRATQEDVIFHSGGIPGFVSYNMYYPDRSESFIALGNYMSGETGDLARALARVEVSGTVELPWYLDDPTVAAFPIENFVGAYVEDQGSARLSLILERGHLYLSVNGGELRRLNIRGPGLFYLRAWGVEVRASTDAVEIIAGEEISRFVRVKP